MRRGDVRFFPIAEGLISQNSLISITIIDVTAERCRGQAVRSGKGETT